MVLKANKFTPEVLIGAPRRSPAVPNHDGTLALYTVSTYSFEEKKTTKEIFVMDLETFQTSLFTKDENAHDATWLGDGTNAIIWLQSGPKGSTNIWIGDGEGDDPSYIVDVIEAPFSDLKVTPLDDGNIGCVFVGLATPGGSLYNIETADKGPSSARIYDAATFRYWKKYFTPEKPTIWYTKLVRSDTGHWKFAAPVHNAFKGTGLMCPFDNGLSSTSDQFDISPSGILCVTFLANSISKPGVYEGTDVRFIPLETWVEEEAPRPQLISTGKYDGPVGSPRFSSDGEKAVFLRTPNIDSSDNRIMMVHDLAESLEAVDVQKSLTCEFRVIPFQVSFSNDGETLFMTADDCGRVSLYMLFLTAGNGLRAGPNLLYREGAVSAYYQLHESSAVLVSSSSFVESSLFQVIDSSAPHSNEWTISSLTDNGKKLGLSPDQVSEFSFPGTSHAPYDYNCSSWMIKPRNFDKSKKYPLALLVHGGPKDAWREAWSTRWNPAVWAEQGYVVVLCNPTGSTGFGLELTDGVNGEWGGRTYRDLKKCFKYIKLTMPYVDTTRSILAGGSYGGYMCNWIAGHSFARSFRAIFVHSGIFNLNSMIASDENSGTADFNGPAFPWNPEGINKWNPAKPELLKEWKTPMLVCHGDLDYRCPVEQGISAFKAAKLRGVEARFLNFPDEGHWVEKPENSLVWHRTVFEFLNKYVGIGKEEDGMEGR